MAARIRQRGKVRIGISGWRYAPWRGAFYPEKLRQADELHYASRQFSTIEINGTFYSQQRPDSFAKWAAETPRGFVFAVKGPRYITHIRRLKDCKQALANFLASGLLRLGPKLGPILWQLPPNFRYDAKRLEDFFKLLPRDTRAAARLARAHETRYRGWATTDRKRPLRHALEIRHDSFVHPAFIALLRKYKIALVCADTVEWPRLMDVTAGFVYCRLHGSEVLYHSGYDARALRAWSRRIAAWAAGRDAPDGKRANRAPSSKRAKRDVYVYFDNDAKVRAPYDARDLIARMAKMSAAAR